MNQTPKNPYETSFENLTGNVQASAKKVVKTAGDTAGAVVQDVKDSFGGPAPSKNLVEEVGLKQVSAKDGKQAEEERKKNLELTRRNLEQINQAIKRARDERLKKQAEAAKQAEQVKQAKKAEEKKKKEDPVWKKMLKGSMGSKEMSRNVSG